MLGIHLQASSIISMPFAIITTIIWFYTEPILILLHQDTNIAKMAALYMRFLVLGLFAYGFLQNILKFLQAQSNCVAPGHSPWTTIGYSCWNCICIDISQFCESTSGSFSFIMAISPYVGHLFDLFKEI